MSKPVLASGGASIETPAPGAIDQPSIDFGQVRAIVQAMMRARLRSAGGVRLGRSGKPRGLIMLLVLYAVMGALIGMLAFAGVDVFTYTLILFGATLLTGGTIALAEASQVLFNVQEGDILGHRPITARTLLLTKSILLFLLTAAIALALNLGPMIMGATLAARPWIFPIVHFTCTILVSLFCSGAVVFLYALFTSWIGRERFDGFIAWAQVAVSVGFIISYQIIPRVIDRVGAFHIDPTTPWFLALPPAWFAALATLLTGQSHAAPILIMAAAAVLSSVGLFAAAVARLATSYTSALATLGEVPAPASAARRERVVAAQRPMHPFLRAWMPDAVERGAFRLATAYIRRDRDIRMRLYPSIGTIVAFAILPVFRRQHSVSMLPVVFAMIGVQSAAAMATLKMSPQYLAADLFRYTPIQGTAALFHGVRKAVIVGFVLPTFVLISPILWFTAHRLETLVAMILVLAAMPTLSLVDGVAGPYLPLSISPTFGRQSGLNVAHMISGAAVGGLLGGLAFMIRSWERFGYFLAIEVVLLALLHVALLKRIRARSLPAVE